VSESAIFRDRSKLSPRYIPEDLPHRQNQMQQIVHVFSGSAANPDKFPLTILQVIGVAGIGKTSTVIKSSKALEELYAKNCKEATSTQSIACCLSALRRSCRHRG
jgi:Cdc6-like AAA superfamily ATPase